MDENCIEFKNHVLKYMRTPESSMSMTILQEECGELIQSISKFLDRMVRLIPSKKK